MANLLITENEKNEKNLLYIQSGLAELFGQTGCIVQFFKECGRVVLEVDCPSFYLDTVTAEINDKIAETLVINYKYECFKNNIRPQALSAMENELLLTSLIAADYDEDKKHVSDRLRGSVHTAVDGLYLFRLKQLQKRWKDIVSFVPPNFIKSQLKEFVLYLLENKKKRVYIDGGKVYDMHYRRLTRADLTDCDFSEGKIIREVILSGCGEVELVGSIPKTDEFYLQEYFSDRITFSRRCSQ